VRTDASMTWTREYANSIVRHTFDRTSPISQYATVPQAFVFIQRINLGLYALLGELGLRLGEEMHLTTLMVTHNMKHAIELGDRLIMMHQGRVVLDVEGEKKRNLTIQELMNEFAALKVGEMADDKMLLVC